MRLAAAAGVERCAVERDGVAFDPGHDGVEVFEVGVGLVEQFGHRVVRPQPALPMPAEPVGEIKNSCPGVRDGSFSRGTTRVVAARATALAGARSSASGLRFGNGGRLRRRLLISNL